MKKISKLMMAVSLALAMVLSSFPNISNVAAATDLKMADGYEIAEQKSIDKYGKAFMQKQTEAYLNYEKLMDAYRKSSGNTDEEEMVYPEYYGGSYTDDDGNLVIYKVKETSVSAKQKTVASANVYKKLENTIENDNFILQEVDHSYNELNDVMDQLNDYKLTEDNEIAHNFNAFWLSDEENCIFVELSDFNEASVQAFKENVCDSDVIKFKESSGEAEAETNINAGRKIETSSAYASVGYRVKRNGNVGFVTAAHLGNVDTNISVNGTVVGKIKKRQRSGSVDAAFVRVTNDDYTPTNTLQGTTNKLSTTISEPGAGTVINKLGASTGATTGKVLSTNATLTVDGITHTNLTSADYKSAPGDSGGTIYSYISSTNTRLTLGIHCAASGSTRYYVKAKRINAALDTSRY